MRKAIDKIQLFWGMPNENILHVTRTMVDRQENYRQYFAVDNQATLNIIKSFLEAKKENRTLFVQLLQEIDLVTTAIVITKINQEFENPILPTFDQLVKKFPNQDAAHKALLLCVQHQDDYAAAVNGLIALSCKLQQQGVTKLKSTLALLAPAIGKHFKVNYAKTCIDIINAIATRLHEPAEITEHLDFLINILAKSAVAAAVKDSFETAERIQLLMGVDQDSLATLTNLSRHNLNRDNSSTELLVSDSKEGTALQVDFLGDCSNQKDPEQQRNYFKFLNAVLLKLFNSNDTYKFKHTLVALIYLHIKRFNANLTEENQWSIELMIVCTINAATQSTQCDQALVRKVIASLLSIYPENKKNYPRTITSIIQHACKHKYPETTDILFQYYTQSSTPLSLYEILTDQKNDSDDMVEFILTSVLTRLNDGRIDLNLDEDKQTNFSDKAAVFLFHPHIKSKLSELPALLSQPDSSNLIYYINMIVRALQSIPQNQRIINLNLQLFERVTHSIITMQHAKVRDVSKLITLQASYLFYIVNATKPRRLFSLIRLMYGRRELVEQFFQPLFTAIIPKKAFYLSHGLDICQAYCKQLLASLDPLKHQAAHKLTHLIFNNRELQGSHNLQLINFARIYNQHTIEGLLQTLSDLIRVEHNDRAVPLIASSLIISQINYDQPRHLPAASILTIMRFYWEHLNHDHPSYINLVATLGALNIFTDRTNTKIKHDMIKTLIDHVVDRLENMYTQTEQNSSLEQRILRKILSNFFTEIIPKLGDLSLTQTLKSNYGEVYLRFINSPQSLHPDVINKSQQNILSQYFVNKPSQVFASRFSWFSSFFQSKPEVAATIGEEKSECAIINRV